jgi:hypothetical protein
MTERVGAADIGVTWEPKRADGGDGLQRRSLGLANRLTAVASALRGQPDAALCRSPLVSETSLDSPAVWPPGACTVRDCEWAVLGYSLPWK